jgi:hypothetical protein
MSPIIRLTLYQYGKTRRANTKIGKINSLSESDFLKRRRRALGAPAKDTAIRLEMAISEDRTRMRTSFVSSTSLSAICVKKKKGAKMATYALIIFSKGREDEGPLKRTKPVYKEKMSKKIAKRASAS